MKLFSVFAFLLFFNWVFAQSITQEKTKIVLSKLASDEMKGREIGTPENDSAAFYIAKLFGENQLDYCYGDSFLIPFEYNGKSAYNVCGIKKGKTNQFLGFSAHFDHIGTNENSTDKVNNGADDNASGTTAVIELSEFFKNKDSEFSMIFLGFNGEEKGMLGSSVIAKDQNLEKVYQNMMALFNFEMIATESAFGKNKLFMTGDDFSDLDELFNSKSVSEIQIVPDPYKSQQLFYRSDNVSFVKKKIIAHSFSTVDMTKAYHYHQPNDEIDVVDFENLTQLINNFGKTVLKLNPKNFQPKYNDRVSLN